MTKIIIFTGKGGVGKSSIATAHGIGFSKEGKKTLLVSTDMAHNLGDIFQIKVGHKITNIKENLDLIELDPNILRNEYFPKIKENIENLAGGCSMELTNLNNNFAIPGFGNLFCMLKIKEFYDSGEYDYILVDCAPTGETLAFLKIPELLAWYMEKFFPVGKTIVRVLKPISKMKYGVTLPSYKSMNTIEKIHKKLIELQYLLRDKDICSIKLVCIPEKMVVEETKRNFMYMNLYQYNVDTVFINRVLSGEISNSFIKNWREIQSKYIKELEEVFVNIPIAKIPWYPNEILGIDAAEKLSKRVFSIAKELPPKKDFPEEKYSTWEKGYIFTLYLPQAKLEDIKVNIHEMDLVIKVNNFNRCIPLPNVLRGSSINKLELENQWLSVYFETAKNMGGEE